MADINENIGSHNIGGANTVEFISAGKVIDLPYPVDHTIQESNIQIESGTEWNAFYATPGSIEVNIESEESDAGTIYPVTVRLRYPKDQATVTASFLSMKNNPQIIKVTDNNLVKTLFGNLNTPMRMKFRILKPGEVSGYNGYQVEFTGKLLYPPYYLI